MLSWRKQSGAMAGLWRLTLAFFMLALFAGQAQAKSYMDMMAFAVNPAEADSPASVALGETIWVPVIIKSRVPWKSMTVRLAYEVEDPWSAGKAADIEIGEVTLDAAQQAPQTVRVPVRVKGEGMFVLKGAASMKTEDENEMVNVTSKGGADYPLTAGVFAFEGRVFVGSSISMAMRHMARANVEKTAAYQMLLKNKDQQAAERMEEQEFKRFLDAFRHLRSLQRQPKAEPKAYVPGNIRRGDAVTIRLNWAADGAARRFLPVKGADIRIFDASSGAQVSAGVVSNGAYTFTAPRDGFSFRGEVFTRHGSEFEVRDPRASGQPLFRVEFSDMNEFNSLAS